MKEDPQGKTIIREEGGYTVKEWLFWGKEEQIPLTHTYHFTTTIGKWHPCWTYSYSEYESMKKNQKETPQYLGNAEGKKFFYWYNNTFYWHNELEEDVEVLIGLIVKYHEGVERRRKRAKEAGKKAIEERKNERPE